MHELTQEERLKGCTAPSIYKSMANMLKKRKKCNSRCFYFDNCPLMAMSQSDPDKKCAMKQFPERVRSRFKKVFLEGEEGMLNEIKDAIYMFRLEANDKRSIKEYIDLMLRLHKAVYGDKVQRVDEREPLTINIQQLNQSKEVKEIPDGTVNVVPRVESKRSIAYKEKIMEECKEVADVESDPETLFNSEKLDEIIGGDDGSS